MVMIGFSSFAFADELPPDPLQFRNATGLPIDLSPLYKEKEIFPIPLTPLKQLASGINPEDIQCKSKLHLLIKHDGTPACVKSKTVDKLTDKTQRKGWIPSEQLWKKLGEQIHSISDSSSCPRKCTSMEPIDSMEEAEKMTNLRIDLPKYIPNNYEFFKFFPQENSLSFQLLPKPLPENLTWGKFYLIDDGIFMTYLDYPVTIDGRVQAAYWAKNHNAQNISLPDDEPIFVKERTVVFDENLELLFLEYPSEAQFNINDDVSVIIVGYVSQEEIISIAKSFFQN